ncbi:hypothetical protein B188_00770 [Candidatus Brocadiaceae bacterium B188]|nr:hypothetical protein B188_00770 [Candidatus Brocadiaceae bacterium B188]
MQISNQTTLSKIVNKQKKPYCKNVRQNIFGSKAVFFIATVKPVFRNLRLCTHGKDPVTLRPLITQGLPLSWCFFIDIIRVNSVN